MARRKTAHAFAIERINHQHQDWQVQKRVDQSRIHSQPSRAGICGSSPPTGGVCAAGICAHENVNFLSPRSTTNNRHTTNTSMHSEIAAPSGQSYAAPNRLTTILEIMIPLGPPTSSGARKSPSDKTNAKVAPASTPGIESGRITRQNVLSGVAPKSCDASSKLRGTCSSEA